MIPQTQSRTGERGRCFNACLASILELPEHVVPDFGEDSFRADVDSFLAKYGLEYRRAPIGTPPIGYHTIEGLSPRGGMHAVVGKDGRVVHDPHPKDGTGRGLVRQDYYGVLRPIIIRARDVVLSVLPKVGESIRGSNGKQLKIVKVTEATNLFGEPEYHIKTATGEVIPVTIKEKR